MAPVGAHVPSAHITGAEAGHVGQPLESAAHQPRCAQHAVPEGQHEPLHDTAQAQTPEPAAPQQYPVAPSNRVNGAPSLASRGQHTFDTQSEPAAQPRTPSSQHEPPRSMQRGIPFWQQSSSGAQAKSAPQQVTRPMNTRPLQQVTSPRPSRHWPPQLLRHGQRAMSRVQAPPMQLQLSPVLAETMHEVSCPPALHVAVRENVTSPSHVLPHDVVVEPGQRNVSAGHDCAAASAADSSTANTIASRTRKEDTFGPP